MGSTTADYNAGTGELATAWALTAAAIVVMAMRVVAKIKISNFNVDDVAMIIALVRWTYSFPRINGLTLPLCFYV
jgi:predicted RNA methylase